MMDDNHFHLVKIWEAARATSAAPAFFDPIAIGPDRVQYLDGGLGANNPVQFAMLAAKEVWPKSAVRCLVSIGAGYKPASSFPSDAFGLAKHAIAHMTDTENIARTFAQHNRNMIIEDRYFRFSVDHGLEDITFDEWQATDRILAHSQQYCDEIKNYPMFERCAKSLTQHSRQQQGGKKFVPNNGIQLTILTMDKKPQHAIILTKKSVMKTFQLQKHSEGVRKLHCPRKATPRHITRPARRFNMMTKL